MVEVGLQDVVLVVPDYDFDSGDSFCWVKSVAVIEAIGCARLASLTIVESKSKYIDVFPLDLCDGQSFEFVPAFGGDLIHVWKIEGAFHLFG